VPTSIQVTGIGRNGNQLYIRFSDNTETEGTRRELRRQVAHVLDDVTVVEVLKAVAIARGLRVAADADNADDFDAMIGQTFSFNRRATTNVMRVV